MKDQAPPVLLLDENKGVYIPRVFASLYGRYFPDHLSDELYILKQGPQHQEYWDAWDECLIQDKWTLPDVGECKLYQDGDLWAVAPGGPYPGDEDNDENISDYWKEDAGAEAF